MRFLRQRTRALMIVVAVVAVTIWAVQSYREYFPPEPDLPVRFTGYYYDAAGNELDGQVEPVRIYERQMAAWRRGEDTKVWLRAFFGSLFHRRTP